MIIVVGVLIIMLIRSNYSSPGIKSSSGSSSVSTMKSRRYSKRGRRSKRSSSSNGSKKSACSCTVNNICGGSWSNSN